MVASWAFEQQDTALLVLSLFLTSSSFASPTLIPHPVFLCSKQAEFANKDPQKPEDLLVLVFFPVGRGPPPPYVLAVVGADTNSAVFNGLSKLAAWQSRFSFGQGEGGGRCIRRQIIKEEDFSPSRNQDMLHCSQSEGSMTLIYSWTLVIIVTLKGQIMFSLI